MRRSLVGLFVATVGLALVTLAGPPAWAHGDTAEFTATRAEANGDGTYTIDVLLTYDDGDAVEGATVTVAAVGLDGSQITLVPGDRAGAYSGDIELRVPGDYALTASSDDPAATTTFAVTVEETTATTTASESPTTTEAASTTTTAAADEDTAANPASIVANGLLLVVGAVGAYFAMRWWRKRRNAP